MKRFSKLVLSLILVLGMMAFSSVSVLAAPEHEGPVTFMVDGDIYDTVWANTNTGGPGSPHWTVGGDMPADPYLTGYVFIEWNTMEDGSGDQFLSDSEVEGPLTVYGIFEPIKVMVTFDANGGEYADTSTTKDIEQTYDATYILPDPDPMAIGYHVTQWNTMADGSGDPVTAATVVDILEPITLYAIWAPNTDTAYTVEHYVMDTEGMYPATPESIDNLTGTTDATLTVADLVDDDLLVPNGITFAMGTVEDLTVTEATIAADGSLVVKMYYARSQYTLTLVSGTGIVSTTGGGTYYFGATANISAIVASGYVFYEWDSSTAGVADLDDKSTSLVMPAFDVTLTAKGMDATIVATGDANSTTLFAGLGVGAVAVLWLTLKKRNHV